MRIFLISNMYPSKTYPFYGIFVQNFENQLTDKDINSTKVVIEGRGISKIDKIKKYIKFFTNTYKALKKNNYDLIYVHYVGHSLLPLLLFKHLISKPLVVNAHGSDIFTNSKIGQLIQKLVTPIIKKAQMIVVPSEYFCKVVEDKFSIQEQNIFVSPSGGIDTNLFKPLDIEKKDIFTIGYVSRIDEGKGWDVLLDAVYLLKQKQLKFKVLLIGSGSQSEQMFQKIKVLDLSDVVDCLGVKPHEELPHYFNQMDVFVFPTELPESLGLVGIEAMACGVPVIGSDVGALPGYIKPGINGELFTPGDAKELADKIQGFILMNSKKLLLYRQASSETARAFDTANVYRDIYFRLGELI